MGALLSTLFIVILGLFSSTAAVVHSSSDAGVDISIRTIQDDGTAEKHEAQENKAAGHDEAQEKVVAEIDGAEENVKKNDRIVESEIFENVSSDMVQLGTQATSPTLSSNAIDHIRNAYLPSVLRLADTVHVYAASKLTPPDFWDMAKKYENILQDYVSRLLRDAATHFETSQFTDITSAMHHIVGATATFRDRIQGALDARHITLDKLSEELERIFMEIVHNLQSISSPVEVFGHAGRTGMVDKVLDDAAVALINLAHRYGIDEVAVIAYLHTLRPHVHTLVVAVGDINERHPKLLPTLSFSIATMLIPESWILRPFLSVFGFGPSGPIKGSAAAWMQRYFWGAAVEAGSWFSMLQAAGMGVLPAWAGLVTKVPMLVGGILAMLSGGQ